MACKQYDHPFWFTLPLCLEPISACNTSMLEGYPVVNIHTYTEDDGFSWCQDGTVIYKGELNVAFDTYCNGKIKHTLWDQTEQLLEPTDTYFVPLRWHWRMQDAKCRACKDTHNPYIPSYNINRIIFDNYHIDSVRLRYENELRNRVALDVMYLKYHHHMIKPSDLEYQMPKLLSFDPLTIRVKANIIRECSRDLQDRIMLARMREGVWMRVPKDICKLIHWWVFKLYHCM